MALTLLHNARLPTTVQTNLILQLTSQKKNDRSPTNSYTLCVDQVKSLISKVENFNKEKEDKDKFKHELIETLKEMNKNIEADDSFILPETITALEYIKEQTELPVSTALLGGKRTFRMGDISGRTCYGCG